MWIEIEMRLRERQQSNLNADVIDIIDIMTPEMHERQECLRPSIRMAVEVAISQACAHIYNLRAYLFSSTSVFAVLFDIQTTLLSITQAACSHGTYWPD